MEEINVSVKASMPQKIYLGISIICSCLVLTLGLSALLGRQLTFPTILQIEPSRTAMSYDTALSFCIGSIGLLAVLFHKKYLAFLTAILLCAMSLLSSAQSILSVNWDITNRFIFPYISLKPNSNIALPISIFCFLLTALSLFSIARKINSPAPKNFSSAGFEGVIIFSMGLIFIFGYALHFDDNPKKFLLMSTNSALGFVLIGISIISFVLHLDYEQPAHSQKSLTFLNAGLISIIILLSWRFAVFKTPFFTFLRQLNWFNALAELLFTLTLATAIYFYQAARSLAQNAGRLLALSRATFEATADGIVVTNKRGRIVDYNQKFLTMREVALPSKNQKDVTQEIFATILEQLTDPEQSQDKLEEIKQCPEKFIIGEIKLKNNQIYEVYSHPLYARNEILGHVYSFHDISYLKQAKEQLLHQATHDALTGLTNRFLLFDRIEQAILHADRKHNLIAVLFLDLNRFKLINDSLGHAVGDKLLKLVAMRLKKTVRDEDTLARIGGDEFILLATDLNTENDALEIAKKFTSSFNLPFYLETRELFLNCSIGISLYPKDGKDASTLLKNADTAMYLAKKNQEHLRFYTESMQKFVTTRLELENELPLVLSKNQLVVYYQPIIDIKSGKICSTEALVRWVHPQLGLLSPDKFIPEAEETGIINTIDAWVLRTACLQNKYWHENNILKASVSVNISVKDLQDSHFADEISQILKDTRHEAKFLELELTESQLLHNTADVIDVLKKIKQEGVRIAIDDFGTGYTGLVYLKHFPIDKLKIDRSLIQNLPDNPEEKAIVEAIVSLCKNLNIRSLVEGVENKEQLEFLRNLECNEAQGYFFSLPLPAKGYERFVASWEEAVGDKLNSLS